MLELNNVIRSSWIQTVELWNNWNPLMNGWYLALGLVLIAFLFCISGICPWGIGVVRISPFPVGICHFQGVSGRQDIRKVGLSSTWCEGKLSILRCQCKSAGSVIDMMEKLPGDMEYGMGTYCIFLIYAFVLVFPVLGIFWLRCFSIMSFHRKIKTQN